jgi:hypothetical protein
MVPRYSIDLRGSLPVTPASMLEMEFCIVVSGVLSSWLIDAIKSLWILSTCNWGVVSLSTVMVYFEARLSSKVDHLISTTLLAAVLKIN